MGDDLSEEPLTRRLLTRTISDTDPREGTTQSESQARALSIHGLKRSPSNVESDRKRSGEGGELKRTSSGGESVPWVGELIRNERTRRLAARISKNSGIFSEDFDSDSSPPIPHVLSSTQRHEWKSFTQELKDSPTHPTPTAHLPSLKNTSPVQKRAQFGPVINEQKIENGDGVERENSEKTDSISTSPPKLDTNVPIMSDNNNTEPVNLGLEKTGARENAGDKNPSVVVECYPWVESAEEGESANVELETTDENAAISLVDTHQSHQADDTDHTATETSDQLNGADGILVGAVGIPVQGDNDEEEDWDAEFGVTVENKPIFQIPVNIGAISGCDDTSASQVNADSPQTPGNNGAEIRSGGDTAEDNEDWDEEFGVNPGSQTPKLLGVGFRASPEPGFNVDETLSGRQISKIDEHTIPGESTIIPPQLPIHVPQEDSDDEDWDTEFGIENTEKPQIRQSVQLETNESEDWDEEFGVSSKPENSPQIAINPPDNPQSKAPSDPPPPKPLGYEEGEDENWDDEFEGEIGGPKPPHINNPTQPHAALANHPPSSLTLKGNDGSFAQIDMSKYQDGDDDDFDGAFVADESPLVLRKASGGGNEPKMNSGAKILIGERGGKIAGVGSAGVHGSALRSGRNTRPKMTVNFSSHRQVVAAPDVCGWEEYWEHSSSDDETPLPPPVPPTKHRPSSAPTTQAKPPKQAPKGPMLLQTGRAPGSPTTIPRPSKAQPPESPTRISPQPPSPNGPEADDAVGELTPEEAELAKKLGYTESKGKTSTWSKSKRTVSLTVKNIFRKKTQ